MRSTRRNRASKRFPAFIIYIVVIGVLVGAFFFIKEFILDDTIKEVNDPPPQTEPDNSEAPSIEPDPEPDPDPEETYTDIRIAAAGDIMFHGSQIESAYDAEGETYDFRSMFED